MPEIIVEVSAPVRAAPEVVYGIFADYHDRHPRVLPRPHFGELVVERGGTGAGTVFRVGVARGPRTYFRMEVTEPEPGRVLKETDLDSDLWTTFTVDPAEGGRASVVTLHTRWTRGGVQGLVERLLAPPLLRRIYAQELRNVDQLARELSA